MHRNHPWRQSLGIELADARMVTLRDELVVILIGCADYTINWVVLAHGHRVSPEILGRCGVTCSGVGVNSFLQSVDQCLLCSGAYPTVQGENDKTRFSVRCW